jgi:hypothetical protein
VGCALVCFIGTLIDGIAFAVYGYIKTCGNDALEIWGDTTYTADLLEICEIPRNAHDCYCVTSKHSECYGFDAGEGFEQEDCDPLVQQYGHLVHISWSICLAMFFLSLILFGIGCGTCCTSYGKNHNPDTLLSNQHIQGEGRSTIQYDTNDSIYPVQVATLVDPQQNSYSVEPSAPPKERY